MIVRDLLPPLPAPVAAGRIGAGAAPCWLCSPGAGELTVEREFLACDPGEVGRGERLDELVAAWQAARARWGGPPGTPVAVGYLSYDLGRARRESHQRHADVGGPGLEFRFYDAFWVQEAASGRAQIWAASADAADRLQSRVTTAVAGAEAEAEVGYQLGPLLPLEPPERHLQAIARVKEYLLAGDVYQVNLARRLGAPCQSRGPVGLGLFQRLRAQAPAPHALWMADHQRGEALVGNSPERFLRLAADGTIETAPIKGTRPRGADPGDNAEGTAAADADIARELSANPKDRAEHVMIVDLERNDLGRICRTGSVEVVDSMRLLSLPSVQHLVTTVRGRLRPDGVGLPEILAACFPGGSVTGAPKIRAMQIIDELEPAARGIYTGATGWLGAGGDFDLAIAIRTARLAHDRLTLWVGGGIVIDSSPAAELEETIVKARAFARLVTDGTG